MEGYKQGGTGKEAEGMVTEIKKWQRTVRGAASLWALLARSSIYKLLAVAAAMALWEGTRFYVCLRSERGYMLGDVISRSNVSIVFSWVLGLWVLILARTERGWEEKSRNTLHRLTLSPRGIFWLKAVFNIGCLTVLFAVQIWLAIWMVETYGRERPEVYASPQRLFLAFYRIQFLHCLLPLAETGKWVRNLLLVLALGMETAMNRRIPVFLILLYALTISWFVSPIGMGATDILYIVASAVVIGADVWRLWNKGGET